MINLRFLNTVRYDVKNPAVADQNRFDCNGAKQTHTYHWKLDENLANPSYKIQIEAAAQNTFEIQYNLTNKFPVAGDGTGSDMCLEEAQPWKQNHFDVGQNFYTCIPMNQLTSSEPIFLGGEVLMANLFSPYGGGLRVKKVSLEHFGDTRSTLYEYVNGVTSYEPLGFAVPIKKLPAVFKYGCLDEEEQKYFDEYRDKYIADVYNKFQFLFANSRELPGPGVLYERVVIKEQIERAEGITELPQSSEYLFEVFSPETIDAGNNNAGLVNQFRNQLVQNNTPVVINSNFNNQVLNLDVRRIETRHHSVIKDFSSIMGSLRKITLYDKDHRKITETENHYLHDNFSEASYLSALNNLNNQGLITETFADARVIVNPDQTTSPKNYNLYGLVSQKIKYPSVQIGQTVINYKTGIKTKTTNKAFDYYSGAVTETNFNDGYGNSYHTTVIPAYRIIPYHAGMGFGIKEGKNMLTQEALATVYKIDVNDNNRKIGLVYATAQTWTDQIYVMHPIALGSPLQQQTSIWRKSAAFSFIGDQTIALRADGLYPGANIATHPTIWPVGPNGDLTEIQAENVASAKGKLTEFNINGWRGNLLTPGWKKASEITLYDVQSQVLEVKDMNGNYSATKMSSDQIHVMATVANAKYGEFTAADLEEPFVSEVPSEQGHISVVGQRSVVKAHTGNHSVYATSGKALSYRFSPDVEKKFTVSVWTTNTNVLLKYCVDGENNLIDNVRIEGKAGDWYLLQGEFLRGRPRDPGHQDNHVEVWVEANNAEVYVDDFRVHPHHASMLSYVYNQWGELSHILDNNNLFTRFEYDAAGRLEKVYKESFSSGVVKTSEVKYNFKRPLN
jgi:hypothetical protein